MSGLRNKREFWLALVFLIIFLGLYLGVAIPLPNQIQEVFLSSNVSEVSDLTIPEGFSQRWLTVSLPETVRYGDAGTVAIKMSAVPVDGGVEVGSGQIPSDETAAKLYDENNIMVEARLDLAGFDMMPAGSFREPITQDQEMIYSWEVFPREEGKYDGTLWLYLDIIPLDGTSGQERRMILAKQFELEVNSLLGFNSRLMRSTSLIGILSCTMWMFISMRKNKNGKLSTKEEQ